MIEISLSKLKNNTLFTLCLRVHELVLAQKTPEMGIDLFFNRFAEAYNLYKAAMEKVVLSAADVAQKDSFRDTMWVALRAHVKNYLRHPKLSAKAEAILAELDKYGSAVYSQSYEAETAIIKSVCNTLDATFSTDLNKIQANVWFDLLKQADAEFEAAQRSFNKQKTDANEVDAASTIRPELEDALRKLFAFLPMQAEVTSDENLVKLVKQLEVEVSRF
jgi:hypothetical protein